MKGKVARLKSAFLPLFLVLCAFFTQALAASPAGYPEDFVGKRLEKWCVPDGPICWLWDGCGFSRQTLEEMAREEEPCALYFQAIRKIRQDGEEEQGVALLRRSAELGFAPALCNLGNLYETGCIGWQRWEEGGEIHESHREPIFELKPDFAQAAENYQKAADAGSAPAAFRLGLLHFNGLGVKKDLKRAKELFLKAQNQGEPEACAFLDRWKAAWDVPELNAAANPDALCQLAEAQFRNWQAGPRSEAIFVQKLPLFALLRQAADAGSTRAQFLLGVLLARTLPPEWEAAGKANSHFQDLMELAWQLQQTQVFGTPQAREGLEWLRKSATGGNPQGMLALGVFLLTGEGCEDGKPQTGAALAWLEKAEAAGSPEAAQILAICAVLGIGQAADGEKGLAKLKTALGTNDEAWPCLEIGRLKEDSEFQIFWFRRAASAGSTDGAMRRDLARLLLLKGSPGTDAEAAVLLGRPGNQEFHGAAFLAAMAQRGWGMPENPALAKRLEAQEAESRSVRYASENRSTEAMKRRDLEETQLEFALTGLWLALARKDAEAVHAFLFPEDALPETRLTLTVIAHSAGWGAEKNETLALEAVRELLRVAPKDEE